MTKHAIPAIIAGITGQVNKFLDQSINRPGVGWPRAAAAAVSRPRTRIQSGKLAEERLHVMIAGNLELELPIVVEATRATLLASLQSEDRDRTLQWKMAKLRVGGFLAHAAHAAAALGARISLCTTVPVPIPIRFEKFCDRYAIDTRYVSGVPSRCPIGVVFHCRDGQVTWHRPGLSNMVNFELPSAHTADVDAILADPCALAQHRTFAGELSRYLAGTGDHVVVGVRVDRSWNRDDLAPTRDRRVWTFVRRHEAEGLARQASVGGFINNEEAFIRRMRDECGIARLVLQLGSRGAIFVNEMPDPHWLHTCPVRSRDRLGAGDTLMTVTTLSSAMGADDRTSLERGVTAATGLVVGLGLPTSFEELDAA